MTGYEGSETLIVGSLEPLSSNVSPNVVDFSLWWEWLATDPKGEGPC